MYTTCELGSATHANIHQLRHHDPQTTPSQRDQRSLNTEDMRAKSPAFDPHEARP
jgi:hypothetical protein